MHTRKLLLPIVTATTLAVVLAACSSSGGTNGKSADTSQGTGTSQGAGTQSAGTQSGGAAVAKAQSVVSDALKNPTSIGITNKLTKAPPTGKFIVICSSSEAVTVKKNKSFADAAKLLGWRTQTLVQGTGPEDPGKALTQAIALKPDMILISGSSLPSLKSQLAAAKAANIPVLAETVTDPKIESVFDNTIDGPPQVENVAKLMANYVVAKTNGKANVAVFNLPVYGVLTTYTKTFTSTVKSLCSACKVTEVDQQITDIGTKTPASVVSTVQRDPSINWLIFTIGDLTIGVPEALKAANLSGKVSIGGETPTQKNFSEMKSGADEAWTGFSAPILGYRDADMAARYFNKEALTPGGDALILPTQIITKDNVGSIVVDDTGYYVGVKDYQSQFKKLWALG